MNRIILYLLILFAGFFYSCSDFEDTSTDNNIQTDTSKLIGSGYDFFNNGKDKLASPLQHVYNPIDLDSLELPVIGQGLIEALEYQLKSIQLRRKKKVAEVGNLEINRKQLEKVIEQLLAWQYTKPLGLSDALEAHQIWGEDQKGNVHYTGYYIPVISVSKKSTKDFLYPIYTRPKNWNGAYPTRAEIDGEGALEGRGLELAYAKNLIDVYFMQVQGSGYVEYRNGDRKLFAYDGTNKHPYRSIGRHMVDQQIIEAQFISMSRIKRYLNHNPNMRDSVLFYNPSYTFFTPQDSKPRGAGLVPLTSDHSIAVDPKYIPLGSCLLGKVPVINERGHLLGHEFRFLVAQDVGGAIKGAGHIDLYSGEGLEGRRKASYLHHYGKLWLLLPKVVDATI